ncbi:hypothetical protein COO20_17625 [Thalassospira marina]|uniref:Uncharacterized protein n=1 Tax=Thalassospira marina TaxID=2048283 RepID=A0A2N3KN74_9PROT|nr:hypothetical protein COO20_17625 [Thalassospira marina]
MQSGGKLSWPEGVILATFRGVTPFDRCAALLKRCALPNGSPKTYKMIPIKHDVLEKRAACICDDEIAALQQFGVHI